MVPAARRRVLRGGGAAGWPMAAAVILGVATAVCVIAQALLLARIIAGVFMDGRSLGDVRGDLGLEGRGPWLVVLTAPGCARCEPVARELERAAGDRRGRGVGLAGVPRPPPRPGGGGAWRGGAAGVLARG